MYTLSTESFNSNNWFQSRFRGSSLLEMITDLSIMANSNLTIGTYSSNFLKYSYEIKSVDDRFATDSIFSVDWPQYQLHPVLNNPSFIDCNFVLTTEPNEISVRMLAATNSFTKFCPKTCDRNGYNFNFVNRIQVKTDMTQFPRNGFQKIRIARKEIAHIDYWIPSFALQQSMPTY